MTAQEDLKTEALSEAAKVASGDESAEDAAKNLLTSKTIWLSAAMAVTPLVFPPAAAWIAANPIMASLAASAATAAMRHLTADGLRLPDPIAKWFK